MTQPNDALRRFKQRLADVHDRGDIPNHAKIFIELIENKQVDEDASNLLAAIVDSPLVPQELADHITPNVVANFTARLASIIKPESILDPTCGYGLSLSRAIDFASPKFAYGVELNNSTFQVASTLLRGKAEVIHGDIFQEEKRLPEQFDLILANPPMGLRVAALNDKSHLGSEIREFAGQLALWSVNHLTPNGMLALLASSQLATNSRFHEVLNSNRACIRALVHIPAGTLISTSIPAYLVLVERGEQADVFVAQLDRHGENTDSLLGNLFDHREGADPSLGVIQKLSDFRGFEQIKASFRLSLRLKGSNLKPVSGLEAFSSIERLDRQSRSGQPSRERGENEIYLRINGRPLDTDDERIDSNRNALILRVNPLVIDCEYFQRWLSTELGVHMIASIATGAVVQRISADSLKGATFHLPTLIEQKLVSESLRQTERIRRELSDIEEACWNGRAAGADLIKKVNGINNPERYEDWLESLPYPLATILWRHHSAGGDARLRIKIIADFFEAFAAFLATIHLSAFNSIPSVWAERQAALNRSLDAARLKLEHATFGMWKCIVEFLSKQARKMLHAKERDLVHEMYALSDERFLLTLISPELVTILGDANAIRNTHLGHVGAMSEREASEVETKLLALVERTRTVFGTSWNQYELVRAESSSYRNGLFHHNIPRVMGTRTPFLKGSYITTAALEEGRLYLIGQGSRRGLQLLPFIRMMPSPSNSLNACYFFNRKQPGGLRFVSYHFEEQSEVCQEFQDTQNVISDLLRPTDDLKLGDA